ncbi:methyltransferase domain-containing protein [Thalassovita mediterranea]|nr:methyltransferase domain-containing protein [Thalassovita mediterranea]
MIITVNGKRLDLSRYNTFHAARYDRTIELVRSIGGGRTVELGGHPWTMTARLLAEPSVDLLATVSAEEVTAWPDEIPVTRHAYEMQVEAGDLHRWTNISANLERTLFRIAETDTAPLKADLVLACEIIEHLTRSPHVMMLNINSWLKLGGRVVLTTPNGSQFDNPLHTKPKMPAYRYSQYARHNYVFNMEMLKDIVEVCGFEVERFEYWSPYARKGLAKVYRYLSRLPGKYFSNVFAQSIVIVARKVENRKTASRLPKAYAPAGDWELIDNLSDGTSQELELTP